MYEKLKDKDLVVIIIEKNEKETIEHVVRTVDEGISMYNIDGAILVIDGESNDGTIDLLKKIKTRNAMYYYINKGDKGKGHAFKSALKILENKNVNSIITLDGDMISIKPEWIEILYKPIENGWDVVNAFYLRSRYDAIITRNIIYPINYAYYDLNLKEPLAGERAYSKEFMNTIDKENIPYGYGMDIYTLMEAYKNELKFYEVNLGLRIHNSVKHYTNFGYRINRMFFEVVSVFYDILSSIGYKKVECKCLDNIDFRDINTNNLDLYFIKKTFLSKVKNIKNYWNIDVGVDGINDELWAKILVNFINKARSNHDKNKVIENLFYAWLGRLYFVYYYYMDKSIVDIYKHLDVFSKLLKKLIIEQKIVYKVK